MVIKELEVTLNNPIETAVQGQMVETNKVLLIGPSRKNSAAASGLKRLFQRAIDSVNDGKEDSGKKKKDTQEDNSKKSPRELIPPKDVVNLLAAAKLEGETLQDAFDFFSNLCVNGCCQINGLEATSPNLDKIDYTDWENMLGEYVCNFLLDSLFR